VRRRAVERELAERVARPSAAPDRLSDADHSRSDEPEPLDRSADLKEDLALGGRERSKERDDGIDLVVVETAEEPAGANGSERLCVSVHVP
jgi:hypothetical protein